MGAPRAVASRKETLDPLIKGLKGYYTDGKLLIKGEAPARVKYSEREATPEIKKQVTSILKSPATPAQLLYYATGSKKKGILYSLLSGLSEPLGALIGLLIILPFLNVLLLSSVLAAVAGIMVYISLDELLPNAHKFGKEHLVLGGILAGMAIMVISLIFLP